VTQTDILENFDDFLENRQPELGSGSVTGAKRFRTKGIPMGKQIRNDDIVKRFKIPLPPFRKGG